MTKVFFDTEFTGLRKDTTLISIGLLSDSSHSFYAEFTDYDRSQVDEWIEKNVIQNLIQKKDGIYGTPENRIVRGEKDTIAKALTEWFAQFEKVEMWADCLAYDWVLFCDIFGYAFNIPKNIHYIPFDICVLFKSRGIDPDISRDLYLCRDFDDNFQKHNAMWGAITTKRCYEKLMEYDLDQFHDWVEKHDFDFYPVVKENGISKVWAQEGESFQFTTKELYELFTKIEIPIK